jgi:Peptidase family M23
MTTAWYQDPISHGYAAQYNPSEADTPHWALDLAMPTDTPITAPLAGTVVKSDYATWSGQPGGGELFIKPDTGGDEYYFYHLDQLQASIGQHVAAGQVVGLSGGQNSGGSHNTSPMWSSGPHLHMGYFEQYRMTPIGTVPYGPDPSPLLAAAAGTKTQLSSFTNLGGPASGTCSQQGQDCTGSLCNAPFIGGLLCPCCVGNSIGSSSAGATGGASVNWTDIGYRAGFVALGLLLVVMGLHHFLTNETVNVDVQEGKSEQ